MTPGVRRGGLVLLAVAGACATTISRYRPPDTLRGYEIIVPARDTLSNALAAALGRAKLRVRREVRGGKRATAVLIHQVFREAGPEGRAFLQGRVYDTRTSALVAAATLPLDSLGVTRRDRADALVAALAAVRDTVVSN